jgi:hypothetical protein
VLEQLDDTVYGADPSQIPDRIRDLLLGMTPTEPCPVRGIILARYSPGVEADLADKSSGMGMDCWTRCG